MREKQKFESIEGLKDLEYKTVTIGEWTFAVKTVTAIKTEVYGEPYSGILTIDISDGKVSANGLHCENFTKRCFKTIVKYVNEHIGIKRVNYKRFKNLVGKFKKTK